MTDALSRVENAARAAADRISALGVLCILGIGIVTVADVVMRVALNRPITGLNEITSPLLALGIVACFPAGFAHRVNITIDLVERVAGKVTIAWLRVFGATLLFVFLLLVTWRLGLIAQKYIARGQTSAMLDLPAGQMLYGITAVLSLSLPVQIVQILQMLKAAFREDPQRSRIVGLILTVLIALSTLNFTVLHEFALSVLDMPPAFLALTCFGLMWLAIFLMVPLGAATGLCGLLGAGIILGTGPSLNMLGTKVQEMMFNDSLAVLPLFLLMGSFAAVSGMSADIYRLAHSLFGHLRGGLAHATIFGAAGFGALTGSSLATSATIGKVALPEMEKRGYDVALSAGTVAAGGTLGQLIPPSTVIVVYALLTEQSIGTLFIATIVPALLAIVLYLVSVMVTVRVSPAVAPAGQRESWAGIIANLIRSWQVVMLVGVVIGGLYAGIFTDTEAASVGAVGAFVFALMRGAVTRSTIWSIMQETTSTIAMMYVLIFGAVNFSFLVGISGVPNLFVSIMTDITDQPVLIVLMIALMYLLLGTVMDSFAIMIITVPVFMPLIVQLGYDPIWWGIVTICLVEVGMITPPFGLNLFILRAIDEKVRLVDVYRGVVPFVIADMIKIGLLIAFPIIVLWLPGTR